MDMLEACRRWVEENFSLIPVNLLIKAYKNSPDDIEILAPESEDVPLFPAWGYVFVPENPLDIEWFYKNYREVSEKCGFIVYETNEIGLYLGIDGAGYDFYQFHWLPLYKLRGLKWHDER